MIVRESLLSEFLHTARVQLRRTGVQVCLRNKRESLKHELQSLQRLLPYDV